MKVGDRVELLTGDWVEAVHDPKYLLGLSDGETCSGCYLLDFNAACMSVDCGGGIIYLLVEE